MPGTPPDSARTHFGKRLRHWRSARGLSQAALGKLLGYDHTFLSRVESGDRWPSPDLAERADRALAADGELAGLGSLVERERRETEVGAAECLPSQLPGIDAPTAMWGLVAAYSRAGREMGGRDLLVPLEHHTRVVVQWQAGASGDASRALLALAAAFAELSGWARLDSADYANALFWYNSGHHWATLAGDPGLASRLLARQSAVHWSVGNADSAIALGAAARAVDGAGPGMRAWACLAESRGHALAGDLAACEARLAEARALLADVDPDAEPWAAGITDSVVALAAGTCYRDLAVRVDSALADRAVEQIARSLAEVPAGAAHGRAVIATRLASALACADQPDAAAEVLTDLLATSTATHSSDRIRSELRAVHDHLTARWSAVAAVRELSARVRAAVPGV